MKMIAAAAAAMLVATPAFAVAVDGTRDASYTLKSSVGFDKNAPESNFNGLPGPQNVSKYTSYDIYGTVAGDNLYLFLEADIDETDESSIGALANLYFDTNPNSGSDIGFEITNDRAFRPGVAGYSGSLGLNFVQVGNNILEVAIPLSIFRDGLADVPLYTQTLGAGGGEFRLSLSQSFGFSVAGGASYGVDRLGRFVATAEVPEPAALGLLGLGLLGLAAVRRRNA